MSELTPERAAMDWLRLATPQLSEGERHEGISLFDAALAARVADAEKRGSIKALEDAAEALSDTLNRFAQCGRHTRARWAEAWLRDRAQALRDGGE